LPAKRMNCRLCQRVAPLRSSHILPDFFRDHSGSMYPTGKAGNLQPFTQMIHTQPGRKFPRKQRGFWERKHGLVEYLLCHDCEQRFSGLEDYAKRFFYSNTNPIRLQLPLLEDPFYTADYKRMKLFQLSLLWRASEARGLFFEAVKLEDSHRERLRLMLLNGTPGRDDEYFCAMLRLIVSPVYQALLAKDGASIETGCFAPVSRNHGAWDSFTFVMGGLVWTFCVSTIGVPEIMRNTYIKDTGRFFLSPMDGDAFLYEYAMKTIRAGNVTFEDAEESRRAKHKPNDSKS